MSKQTTGRKGVATNDLEVSLAPLLTMFLIGTTGMTICHKLAIAAVKLPLLLVAFQTFTSLVISGAFWPMVRLGGIADLLKYLMVSLCYMGTLICSMIAYFYCSLSTVVVVGACSPLFGIIVEVLIFRRSRFIMTVHTAISLLLIVTGLVIYGLSVGNFAQQSIGVAFMIAKMLVGVMYQLSQRWVMVEDPVDISNTGMLFYNNLIAFIGILLLMLWMDEYSKIWLLEELSKYEWLVVGLSCLDGTFVAYIGLEFQRLVSATSYMVSNDTVRVLAVLFGIVFLREPRDAKTLIACGMVILGSGYYTWDRNTLHRQRKVKRKCSRIKSISDIEDATECEKRLLES
mmetsp:Transcript_16018/g.28752  ORF Transcript_16018/g.28752 Transcript_16018/m.28752 type:complete len:344 (+) Transcript_16018:86-1117(+)